MKFLLFISTLIGFALLYLLSSASANTELFSHNYYSLLILAGVLALSLGTMVAYQLWQLHNQLKAQIYGSKLTLRLTMIFTLIAVLPGLLVYAVSVQFLSKSIESWFDVKVEKALEGGVNLGRNSLNKELKDLGKKSQFIAQILSTQLPNQYGEILAKFIDKNEAQEAAIFDLHGNLQSYAGSSNTNKAQPDLELLHQSRREGLISLVDSLHDNSLILRVLVPIKNKQWSNDPQILQFSQPVSKQLSADAVTVQSVYEDYQELSLSRLGLKRLYGITLTLSLLIVLLSAVSAAFYYSTRLSAPLSALATGTRAVAQGDFTGNYPILSNDELGALTGLFNQMIAQLRDAKEHGETQQRQIENAKAHLESVLTHLSSGVLVVDENFKLRSANASASQILGIGLQNLTEHYLKQIADKHPLFRSFAEVSLNEFADLNRKEWQFQLERSSKNGLQMLLIRGTRLNTPSENSFVIVFDDITHLLQAERQAAWGEVARRLAHEIKNPLTPIQLSAERLQLKLDEKLDAHDARILKRATDTIVSQVAAMKNMVTDFADYARAPAPHFSQLDMHQLIQEIMGLYEGNSSPIILQLDARNFLINGDPTRLRQVLHNLLQNAHDGLQHIVMPKIVIATRNLTDHLQVIIRDNGSGFSPQILARVFEPYMTTKSKGTGLGLPIVKKITEEHGGNISIENNPEGGAQITLILPLAKETEVA